MGAAIGEDTEIVVKKCGECHVEKPFSAFYRSRGHHKYGIGWSCKSCTDERNKKWHHNHKETATRWAREYQIRRYGLEPKDYDYLLLMQNYECAICGKEDPGYDRRFSVDHDHTNNKHRGLLCRQCNAGIGSLQESAQVLRAAADYLDAWSRE